MNLQQLDLGKRQRSARQAPEQEASAPRARRRATAFDRSYRLRGVRQKSRVATES